MCGGGISYAPGWVCGAKWCVGVEGIPHTSSWVYGGGWVEVQGLGSVGATGPAWFRVAAAAADDDDVCFRW